jgi:2'-5' RNA ligase
MAVTQSLNVPVPGDIRRQVDTLRPYLGTDRQQYTLVCKRLGDGNDGAAVRKRVRRELAGHPPFEVRTTGLETFDDPARGDAPVVYLAVESPPLVALHERLCDVVDPVPGIEGPDYVPHITIGRGGSNSSIQQLEHRRPVAKSWTVSRLVFWDGRHGEEIGRLSLPA